MNRRAFLGSLLGLAAVAALPMSKAEASQPAMEPALEPLDASGDLPAADAADAQYYRRRPVRRPVRRVVYRRPVRRVVVYRRPVRRVVYRRPVYYRRPVVYRRPVYYRPVRRVYW
jgi:hypothetical protein